MEKDFKDFKENLKEIETIGFQLDKILKKRLVIFCVKKEISLTDFFLNAINDALGQEVENDNNKEKE